MFKDPDPLEQYLNKTVTDMTAEELITYIKTYMSVVYQLDLALDPSVPRERSVFKALQKTYGADAGLIVKWVFWKYQGKYNGEFVNFFSFVKARKWWTDLMYQEMQLHRQREVPKNKETQWKGFATKL